MIAYSSSECPTTLVPNDFRVPSCAHGIRILRHAAGEGRDVIDGATFVKGVKPSPNDPHA